MNSIASPTRTDRAGGGGEALSARTVARIAVALAAVLLTLAIISFRPFQPTGTAVESGGDTLNQLGYGSLGALAVLGLFMFVDRRVVTALFSPWWLLLFLFLALSVLNAPFPPAALRAALFTIVGIIVMAAVLTLPRDAESFSAMLAFAGLTVVGISYTGLVLLPEAAIHGSGGLEPQHAGFWRGVFTHKNVAGPVMACFSFAGIYLWRRGWARSGLLLLVLTLVFLSNTGSKTTAGTAPVAVLLVMLPCVTGMRFLVPVLLALILVLTGIATLGVVFIEPIKALAHEIAPGLTYTGRTTLWDFMGEMIAQRPWLGYGYESFWGKPIMLNADKPFDWDWDIRGIVHGHDSYLDIALAMGLPALAVAIIAFVLAPMRDYMRVPPLKENVYLADLFMMILAFTLFNAFLESFFFSRADPVWLFMVLAALGLRLVARFPVQSAPRR